MSTTNPVFGVIIPTIPIIWVIMLTSCIRKFWPGGEHRGNIMMYKALKKALKPMKAFTEDGRKDLSIGAIEGDGMNYELQKYIKNIREDTLTNQNHLK